MSEYCANRSKSCHIPDDILSIVFLYLDPLSLFRVEEVCSTWRNICRSKDEPIWHGHILLEAQKSSFNIPSETNIKRRVEQLKMNRLLKGLVGIDLHRCVEKQDYQKMLIAKLLFHKIMSKELRGDDSRFAGKYLSMYYPEWSLQIPSFKASFIFTRSENQRLEITFDELCHISWEFSFKYQLNPETNETEPNENPRETFRVQFHENYSMFSELQPDHNYTWKFVHSNSSDEKMYIQVDSYPALSISRDKNLAWGLENMYVRIRQKNAFDPASVPII